MNSVLSAGRWPFAAEISALFGWLIQPDSASRNSIFLSREISQPYSQQYFPLTQNQPASQPNKAFEYQEPKATKPKKNKLLR